MKAYAALVSARFRMLLQYRVAAVAGVGTQLFFGYVLVMVYEAFYRTSSAAQPLTFPAVVTYVWLGQAFLAMLPWNVDSELRALIRSGTVAYELLRPLDLYSAWYCRILAGRVAPTVLRAVPIFVIAGLFLGMQAPPSWASAAAWAVTMLGALLLGCALTALMTISLLWTISGDGLSQLVSALATVLSGMIVPLPLFPAWAQPLLNALPFRGLIDTPYRLYLGHIPPTQTLPLLAHQLAWTTAIILAGRLLLTRGRRRLVIQGG